MAKPNLILSFEYIIFSLCYIFMYNKYAFFMLWCSSFMRICLTKVIQSALGRIKASFKMIDCITICFSQSCNHLPETSSIGQPLD